MSLEICCLSVFEKTIILMVSKQSFTQFTVNKRNQLMRLTLDWPNSFFKSEPAQLDSWGQTKLFMIILELSTSLFCSLPITIKKLFLHDKDKDLDERKFNAPGFVWFQ